MGSDRPDGGQGCVPACIEQELGSVSANAVGMDVSVGRRPLHRGPVSLCCAGLAPRARSPGVPSCGRLSRSFPRGQHRPDVSVSWLLVTLSQQMAVKPLVFCKIKRCLWRDRQTMAHGLFQPAGLC